MESVILLSSHEIIWEEIRAIPGEARSTLPEDDHITIWSEEEYILVYLSQEYLPDHLEIMQQDKPDQLQEVRTKLGGEPQSYIEIAIGRTPGSEKLAVDFACRCAEQWPCVVDNCKVVNQIYSKEEMIQLQKEGKGFT